MIYTVNEKRPVDGKTYLVFLNDGLSFWFERRGNCWFDSDFNDYYDDDECSFYWDGLDDVNELLEYIKKFNKNH